jgi:effector-binding domain-containing protein
MYVEFYKPYEGTGSSLAFNDESVSGNLNISYQNPLKTIKYQYYNEDDDSPTEIAVHFKAISPEKTSINWKISTPKRSFLTRAKNLWSEIDFLKTIDQSNIQLTSVLSNKIDRDQLLSDIKYDSLIIENAEAQIIFGVNVTSSTKKDALFKNILMNYSKASNFITNDLNKKVDEIGFPVLLLNTNDLKNKELSYFLGFPLSKKEKITDNNFSYKEIAKGQKYSIYYKGNFNSRIRVIQTLIQKAKSEEKSYGEIQQIFLETPQIDEDVLMKISLPVN